MAYEAPEYQGHRYLFEGASRGLNNIGAYLLQKRDEHQKTKAETEQADTAFAWLAPLLNNDEKGIEAHGDELAKFPSLSLSQKKATLGGLTMYLTQKAAAERQQREQTALANREGFNRAAASAFTADGIDLSKLGAAVQQYPGGVDVEKLMGYVKGMGAEKPGQPKTPQATKLSGRDVIFSPDTGAFQILNDPATEMSPFQRAQLELRAIGQKMGLGDPLKTAGMSDAEKQQIRDELEQVLGGKAAAPAPASKDTGKEVIRVTGDGKRAVFDAKTKTFLRYAE